ncbi:putative CXXCH cytochrome family protein [Povalibacter uvarum]|uniref:Putative CXXCH cytochrome family protein n=1 Tax=Povalibacter uvarum TaxID=732238 RepID=A0A841HR81_9GAMM|nr:tetratricopeptide repeat protein [Povalibacter uvarum]MBB6095144.1 putative CXXCH cytochrome family protein [Povalibacter uvarum]
MVQKRGRADRAIPGSDLPGKSDASASPARRNTLIVAVIGAAAIGALLWAWTRQPARVVSQQPPASASGPHAAEAQYVDEQQCATCHADQAQRWHGSHHDLAMQEADATTVLGNFNDTAFTKDGIRTRFFQRDGRYWINTDGPDGKPTDYAVKYTFGVEPLQQYLLELDRGRLQAFTVAWDTARRRWFHLYPDERIDYRDELHWTKPSQNWNFMCAECHSTDLKKNYDAQTQTYKTTWKQIDVGCQACHGPASRHLELVQEGASKTPSPSGSSLAPQASSPSGFPVDLAAPDATSQIETCARCHSRRAVIWDEYRHAKPFLDTHLPSLLDTGLYFADGQIDGEVYEYGSFLQSKMHQKGLRCSDCHDPHSLQTRAPGNQLCTSCHNTASPAARASIDTSGLKHKNYDTPAHHFHASGSPGSQCVDCHAPQRTYMVVDPRRDHSFRVPRPDLSQALGTPNACSMCHTQRSSQWAADAIAKWYGPDRRREPVYGEALWAGRTRQQGAATRLAALANDAQQPAIVRATSLALLSEYPSPSAFETIHSQLSASDPLLRLSAVNGLSMIPPERLAPLTAPLLSDPIRAVRLDAVRLTATVPAQALGAPQRGALMTGIREFEAAQRTNSDQPTAWANLGNLYSSLGDVPAAESAFQTAIRLDAGFVPAYVNLADMKSRAGDNAIAIALLQSALGDSPGSAALQHALGLALARERRYDEALRELAAAAKGDPGNARYSFVYGVALYDTGKKAQGVDVLKQALQRHPGDGSLLNALASYAEASGDAKAARKYRSMLQ